MPRVFLIAEPTVKKTQRDGGTLPGLVPLFEHGDVTVLVTSADPRPVDYPEETLARITQRLEGFKPEEDFLAWAGGDTLTALMVGVVLERWEISNFRWLRYDRARGPNGERTDDGARYVPVPVTIFPEKNNDDDHDDDDAVRTRSAGLSGS